MSYEDELVVVLPASGTGFVARAHAVNNGSMPSRCCRT